MSMSFFHDDDTLDDVDTVDTLDTLDAVDAVDTLDAVNEIDEAWGDSRLRGADSSLSSAPVWPGRS